MQPNVAPLETIPWTLPDLIAFIRVGDHRSFTRAGAILGESKGSVSRRIARLESALGVRLLQRTSRTVVLTEAGAYFRAAAVQALENLDSATTHLRRAQREPEGTLRLTAPIDLAQNLLPGLIKSFLAANPKVRVELVVSDSILDLAAHRLDVAMRAAEGLADSNDVGLRLLPTEMGLYASPAYLAAAGVPRKGPATLAQSHALLLREGDARGPVCLRDGGGREERLVGRPLVQASSFSTVMAAAEEGLGVAYLPVLIVRRALATGRLRRVLPRWSSSPAQLFLVHARGLLPARVRAFRDHVKAELTS
jgi:DNA-binding transcriptional LysR family regulator